LCSGLCPREIRRLCGWPAWDSVGSGSFAIRGMCAMSPLIARFIDGEFVAAFLEIWLAALTSLPAGCRECRLAICYVVRSRRPQTAYHPAPLAVPDSAAVGLDEPSMSRLDHRSVTDRTDCGASTVPRYDRAMPFLLISLRRREDPIGRRLLRRFSPMALAGRELCCWSVWAGPGLSGDLRRRS